MIILALDDELGALKILCRAIESVRPDAQLHSFTQVKEALAFADTSPVDIAFLDIRMPVMTGLEVAKQMKRKHPELNVIFTTGFSEYAVDAIKLRSSGYLMKPITKNDVAMELEHLRNPVKDSQTERRVHIRTFGAFEVFADGMPLIFHRERTKELLAYLVDRRGSTVTRKELAAALFEDREYSRATQAYLSQLVNHLRRTLSEAMIGDMLISQYNAYAVNTAFFTCDAYDYLDGDPGAINLFHGEYMSQYTWAEGRIFQFYE